MDAVNLKVNDYYNEHENGQHTSHNDALDISQGDISIHDGGFNYGMGQDGEGEGNNSMMDIDNNQTNSGGMGATNSIFNPKNIFSHTRRISEEPHDQVYSPDMKRGSIQTPMFKAINFRFDTSLVREGSD